MKKWLAITAIVIAAVAAKEALELPISKITLHAIDESGKSIAGAKVTLSFDEAKPQWGGGKMVNVIGVTDANGKFSGEGHSLDTMGGQIEKDHYYSSSPRSFKFTALKDGRWQPWNPTLDVVLKEIIRPVPMYARFKYTTELPTLNDRVGFDLEATDWVAPHGGGRTNDLIFKVTKRVASFRDFGAELQLTFSNPGDGIQEISDASNGASRLRSPQVAPDHGYVPTLAFRQGNSSEGGEYGMKSDGKNYLFRVRTVLDQQSKVVTALYGKIYDGLEFYPVESKTARLRFTYYFNPTPNDRSLEFDPKRNLFVDLRPLEQVTAP